MLERDKPKTTLPRVVIDFNKAKKRLKAKKCKQNQDSSLVISDADLKLLTRSFLGMAVGCVSILGVIYWMSRPLDVATSMPKALPSQPRVAETSYYMPESQIVQNDLTQEEVSPPSEVASAFLKTQTYYLLDLGQVCFTEARFADYGVQQVPSFYINPEQCRKIVDADLPGIYNAMTRSLQTAPSNQTAYLSAAIREQRVKVDGKMLRVADFAPKAGG